ncbi:UDP-N-acetylmuramate--L-alanine ligase [Candidatus Uhrbacteria bacterium]|nr:UDP-N-acetylmuramate--L-alanine ligase [Candidatus Uhrbacteria bacterium]
MDLSQVRRVHLVGIGGINMSGVAKLLARAGVRVTGSDVIASEATAELIKAGIPVIIGHEASNVPTDTELVIYTSAAPEKNPERLAAAARGIPQVTNFAFLGAWLANKRCLLVCGTHGKSTTTALTGLLLEGANQDPMVIVGSRVPSFPDGNVRFGGSDMVVIEGDEYARHFLEFEPYAVILNNLELDHTDIFPDLQNLLQAFRELLEKVRNGGIIVANADDPNVQTLIGQERAALIERGVRIRTFGFGTHADHQVVDYAVKAGEQSFGLRDASNRVYRFKLSIPGKMNVMNCAAALSLISSIGIPWTGLEKVLGRFTGIWRRFERIAERDGILVISDYGHHPTAVAATLEAAKAFYPGRRIVLAFQPHQRRRTRDLFLDFVPSFDRADALLLVEIYDVAGRESEDEAISSRDLQDAIVRHDADRAVVRSVDFAPNSDEALAVLRRWKRQGDVIIVMGAGDIYKMADKIMDV